MTATRISWSASAVLAAIWATRTESGSLGSTTTSCAAGLLDRGQQHAGGRPVARPAVDDDRARLLEQPRQPRAGGDGDDRASGAGRGSVARPPGRRSGSPGSGAAGPPRCRPRSPRRRRRRARGRSRAPRRRRRPASPRARRASYAAPVTVVVGRVEEVHHLVGRPAGRRSRRPARQQRLRDPARTLDLGRDPPGQRGLGGVEDHHDATAAGVDHARVAQHLELLGGAGQRLAGGGRGGGEHVAGARLARCARRSSSAASAAARQTESIVPSTGIPTAA